MLDAACPSKVGIYVLIGMELRNSLTFHMSHSFALLTYFCHVFHFDSSTLPWKIFRSFLHFLPSSCLSYLINLHLDHCACFRRISMSLFHHLLLNGQMLARGVVSVVACLIASLTSFASLSTPSAVGVVVRSRIGKYFSSFSSKIFQSVLL